MKINWILRLKNKATLIAICGWVVTIVYIILSWFNVSPKIPQDEIMQVVEMIIMILIGLGIVVDSTTEGLSDSPRALNYDAPASSITSLDEIEAENLLTDEPLDEAELSEDDPEEDEVES